MQNAKLASCKNKACLKATLQDIIKKFEPIYRNSKRLTANMRDRICKVPRSIDIKAAIGLRLSPRSVIKNIEDQCGASGASISICRSKHGNLLFADCNIDTQSSQVNAPSWIFRLTSASRLQILYAAYGPFDQQRHWCNGLPDFKTEARENVGDSNVVIYRFDGKNTANISHTFWKASEVDGELPDTQFFIKFAVISPFKHF